MYVVLSAFTSTNCDIYSRSIDTNLTTLTRKSPCSRLQELETLLSLKSKGFNFRVLARLPISRLFDPAIDYLPSNRDPAARGAGRPRRGVAGMKGTESSRNTA
jgi:hypothetical protein